MFGNKISYYNGNGGIRRGLIWQSSSNIHKKYDWELRTIFNRIGTSSSIVDLVTCFRFDGKSRTGIIFKNFSDTYFPVNNTPPNTMTLNNNLYPITGCISTSLKIDNYETHISRFINQIQNILPEPFVIKLENVLLENNNETLTVEAVMFYIDLSKLDTFTKNNRQYYDLRQYKNQQYLYEFNTPYLNLGTDIEVEVNGTGHYNPTPVSYLYGGFEDFYGDITGLTNFIINGKLNVDYDTSRPHIPYPIPTYNPYQMLIKGNNITINDSEYNFVGYNLSVIVAYMYYNNATHNYIQIDDSNPQWLNLCNEPLRFYGSVAGGVYVDSCSTSEFTATGYNPFGMNYIYMRANSGQSYSSLDMDIKFYK